MLGPDPIDQEEDPPMQTTSSRPNAARSTAAARPVEWPMSKGWIWTLSLILPIAGSALYYAWRRDYPDAASYANRTSWVGWGLLLLVAFIGSSLGG